MDEIWYISSLLQTLEDLFTDFLILFFSFKNFFSKLGLYQILECWRKTWVHDSTHFPITDLEQTYPATNPKRAFHKILQFFIFSLKNLFSQNRDFENFQNKGVKFCTLFNTSLFVRFQLRIVYSLISANSRHIFHEILKLLFVRPKNFKSGTSKNFWTQLWSLYIILKIFLLGPNCKEKERRSHTKSLRLKKARPKCC